jgi:hypothetical protein
LTPRISFGLHPRRFTDLTSPSILMDKALDMEEERTS